jgi:uncharacterized protein (TIGR02001 family)
MEVPMTRTCHAGPTLGAILALTIAAPALSQTVSADTAATLSTQDAPGAFVVYTGLGLEFTSDEYGRGTGTSISLDSYIEAEINGFYFGIYGERTDEKIDNEVNLYFGYRNELESGFSYDLGYTRYIYPNDGGNCCGEITFGLFAPVGEQLGFGLDLAYDPDARIGNVYVLAEYYASEKWTISANYGVYEVEGASSEQEWDFGATYALTDEAALDLRYYDGSEYDGYMALYLSFDTTLFGG